MSRRRPILALLFLVLIAIHAPAADRRPLAAQIDKILAQPDVARGFWGIEIVSLDNGKTLYAHDADKLFTPASNAKLFTTATAFALLGPDYRFHTTVETSGTIDKHGRLDSDLVIVGRGDPNLSGRTLPYNLRTERKLPPIIALENLADQLVQKGLRFVDGDIVADDSYYAFERYGEGWAQDDLVWEWGAPVSALTINDNVIFVSILPADRPGERAFVDINPFPEYYKVDNRVMTTPTGTGPRKIYINREPGSNQLTLWGNIPIDDQGANEALSIEDPADFTAKLFRDLLEKRGVTIYGRPKTHHTELASLSTFSITATASGGGSDHLGAPVSRLPLILGQYDSQPLSADLRVINKVSQNLHAELLLRLLGKEKGAAGTVEGGLEVERSFLAQADIRPEEYTLYDGSGLSRQDLVTPHAIVKLLTYAKKQPWGASFADSLPVAGVDGSLVERFTTKTSAQGRVHGKTGSLDHVNSLSGYLTTEKGEHVAFAILANNHNVTNKHAIETIDGIVQCVVDESRKK